MRARPSEMITTRRNRTSAFRKPARSVSSMKRNRGGRPSKGERRYVNAPVSLAAAEKLERYSELTGEGKGPAMARIFEAHIDELNLEALEDQLSLSLHNDEQTA